MEFSKFWQWRWQIALSLAAVAMVGGFVFLSPAGTGNFFEQLCSGEFMPHGHCYYWLPEILWLHVVSDAIVAASYFAIPICLVVLIRKRRGLRFRGVFWLFSLFILFCGLTHVLEIYSVWNGIYRLTGFVKLATAIASISTAIYLVKAMPLLSRLPLPKEFEDVERRLGARERIFEAILSGGGEGFVTIKILRDDSGRIDGFLVDESNEVAAREMIVAPARSTGMRIDDVFEFSRKIGLPKILEETYLIGSPRHEVVEFKTETNDTRWMSYKIVPTGDLLALFFNDVSKERLTELKLQKALEQSASKARRESDINAARAQAALEAAVHGILIVGDSGKIVQCNAQLLEFFGYEEAELIGQSVDLLVPVGSHASHLKHRKLYNERPVRRKMGSSQRLEGRRKDGSTFPVEVGLNPFETPEGKFIGASVLDITDRLQARAALEESELRFQQAASGGNVGIWHWYDIEVEDQYWSPKFYELIGYEPEELKPCFSNFQKILHPDDHERILHAVEASIGNESGFDQDYRLLTKENGYRWFYAAGILVTDPSTEKTRMVGSIQDIQRRKDQEQHIRSVNEVLESKNREMEQMTYAVSHDLKAPLVSIQGLVNLLLNGGDDFSNDSHELLKRVEKSAKHMNDLIGDLLEMSRVGRTDEKLEDVDLNDIAAELSELFSEEIKRKQCQWEVATDLPTLKINRVRIRQALQNLAGNALKYGCEKPGRTVLISSKIAEDYVDVIIEDDGPGVPPECVESIFKLFKRLDVNKEGTGLGLAIVTKIMNTYGGIAFAESREGGGVRFILRFYDATKAKQLEADDSTKEPLLPTKKTDIKELPQSQSSSQLSLPENELRKLFEKFIYTAAHDFNSPLVTIKGNLDFLELQTKGQLDGDAEELIRRSSKAANRMSGFLEALVQYSETLFHPGKRAELDLFSLVREIIKAGEAKGRIPINSISVSSDFPCASFNSKLAKILFENVIEYAVDQVIDQPAPRIEITSTGTDSHWTFSITNNGSNSTIENVFAPFNEIGNTVDRLGGGGLALCKVIVELHGGEIWIDPVNTKGSRIRFTISKLN